MIKYLGKINIPAYVLKDVKSEKPDRVSYQLESQSHKANLKDLDSSIYNLDGYDFYTNEATIQKEYTKKSYLDLVPITFLEYHSLSKPSNVIVLRVDPGSFTRPHVDTFKNSLLKNNKDLVFDDIVRLWIPLEDSTFGQVLFVGDQVLSSYKAGEVYTFDNYTLHSAANAGLDIRYTLLVYTTKNNLT
jgi:hypothetical protein